MGVPFVVNDHRSARFAVFKKWIEPRPRHQHHLKGSCHDWIHTGFGPAGQVCLSWVVGAGHRTSGPNQHGDDPLDERRTDLREGARQRRFGFGPGHVYIALKDDDNLEWIEQFSR